MLPLLQQAGILYRQPRRTTKYTQRTAFSAGQGEGTCIHTHTPTLSLGIRKAPVTQQDTHNV